MTLYLHSGGTIGSADSIGLLGPLPSSNKSANDFIDLRRRSESTSPNYLACGLQVADLTDVRMAESEQRESSYSARVSATGQLVELRLIPWLKESSHQNRFREHTTLVQRIAGNHARQLLGYQLQDIPPAIILESSPKTLEQCLATLSLRQRLECLAQLFLLLDRTTSGGLFHGNLSTDVIFLDPENDRSLSVDFYVGFCHHKPFDSEATMDDDMDAVLAIARQLLNDRQVASASNWQTLPGQLRGRLRSLLRQSQESDDRLDLFEQWLGVFADLSSAMEVQGWTDQTASLAEVDGSGLLDLQSERTAEVVIAPIQSEESICSLPKAGELIGRYRLRSILGQGGMGIVYLASDVESGADVAVKVLRPNGSDIGRSIRRFKKEARLLARIENDFVTRLLDTGCDRGFHYLAMEYVAGTNLKTWMKRQARVDEHVALNLIGDVARALVDAHRQEIIHRDIKPENILLHRSGVVDGGSESGSDDSSLLHYRVKLSDFGIARSMQQTLSMELTRAGSLIGTPTYMSPEQCKGSTEITPAADIYALGITLYHLLAGQPPFEADDPIKLAAMHCFESPVEIQRRNQSVSDPTAQLLVRMLSKNANERPSDAEQLVREVEKILRGEVRMSELHVKRAVNSQRCWERVFRWELESSPQELWPYVSNTERLNRAIGLQAVNYRTEKDARRGLRRFGAFRMIGMNIQWEEFPFEWVEAQRMGVLREFTSGPFRWFQSIVELIPKADGGTTLVHTVRIETKNWLGRMVAAIEAGWKGGAALDQVYRRIDHALKHQRDNRLFDPFEESKRLKRTVATRLQQRVAKMADHGIPLELSSRLAEYIANAAPQAVAQMRPLELAQHLRLPEEVVLDACLVAAHCGILQLRWDILCPTCRAPASTAALLSQIGQHTECEACDIEFQSNVANAIELVFQVHPEIREGDHGQYCIGGPEHSPHVVTQLRIEPNERLELTIPLKVGDYLIRSTSLKNSRSVRVRSQGAPSHIDMRLSQFVSTDNTLVIRSGAVSFSVSNDLDSTQTVRLERTIDRNSVMTASAVSSLPRFRQLFPDQILSRENAIASEDLTLLVVRMLEPETLYEQLGDSDAYQLIQQTLQLVERCVLGQRGAIIKTIGETVLASFRDSTQGLRAAIEIQQVVCSFGQGGGVQVASALHHGPLLVTTQNGRLDYFGTTVRQALALSQAATHDIVISDAVFSDTAVQEFIQTLRRDIQATAVACQLDLPGSCKHLVQQIHLRKL